MARTRLYRLLVIALTSAALGLCFAAEGGEHRHHHPHQGCPCPEGPAHNAWCDVCGVGYIGPVEVHSQALHETLDAHGHRLSPASFTCPACKKALAEDGYCEEHRLGFVGGLTYFSRLAYEMARAEVADPTGQQCAECKVPASGDPLWCESCDLGRLGNRIFRDRPTFDRLVEAIRILRIADERAKTCEACAVAIVTDTECPIHRTAFRDGKEIPRPEPAKGTSGDH